MAEMSMNKAIHAAVRRDLQRFVTALAAFPDGDLSRASQLAAAWENFEDQLQQHHTGEHEIAWPALTALGVSPDLLEAFDEEHDVLAQELADADAAIKRLKESPSHADAQAALAAITELQDVAHRHFEHEERAIEPVFAEHAGSPELKAMGRKFGKVSPARGGRFFAWVLDGATAEERAAATRDIPGPVLAIIGGIFGRGYRRDIAPVWRTE